LAAVVIFVAFTVCEFVDRSKICGLTGIRIPTNHHLQRDFWPKPMLEHNIRCIWSRLFDVSKNEIVKTKIFEKIRFFIT
jgi:hypothetical protein